MACVACIDRENTVNVDRSRYLSATMIFSYVDLALITVS